MTCSGQRGDSTGRRFKLPPIPAFIVGSEARISYMGLHFWDDCDFKDPSFVRSREGQAALCDYMDLLSRLLASEGVSDIGNMMEKARADSATCMLLFMFDKVEEYVSREEREQIIKYGLIHYNGTKPWDGYCANMDIWWEYYRKSVFFDPRYYYRFFISGNYVYDRLSFRQRMGLIVHFFTKGRRKV